MSNNHIITRQIGNLRGVSTDSIFLRPSNVADLQTNNIQRAPDGAFQLRRGYQCQISEIGGMGVGTFNDPISEAIQTVTIGVDGFLYQKADKQIYFNYDGEVTGIITGITQANPAQVTSPLHGLQTGAIIRIVDVNGMIQVDNLNFTITVVDANNFTLNGVDSTPYSPYISGGSWVIVFTQYRYLTMTIFTDPRFLTTNPGWSVAPWSFSPWGAPSGESITCNITANRAAQISTNAFNVNTVAVQFGHELVATDVIQFIDSTGINQQRNVTAVTPFSVSFDGYPVTVVAGAYLNQFFDIPFRKGFDVTDPYLISTFIATITNPTTGVFGLKVDTNGDTDHPAAFLQIFEPTIIDSISTFTIDFWYWTQVNSTINPPFPGSANILFQNSPNFENASMAAFDDVIYIANGWDYPQKFDGQTVYRTGMPPGIRPAVADDTGAPIKPFSSGNVYQYAITYEQIDNRGHIVEGVVSDIMQHTVMATAAMDVTVTNLISTVGANWNTDGALAPLNTPATVYGPDGNGFYYDLITVNAGSTLKIGDSAYYYDTTAATTSGTNTAVLTLNVNAGHNVLVGDTIYFVDSSNVLRMRQVTITTLTSITINGDPVTVTANTNIGVYKTNPVFGDVAIVSGAQANVNTINVLNGVGNTPSIQMGDVVQFIDTSMRLQRRNVTAVTSSSITIDQNPVSVDNNILIASTNQRPLQINVQRTGSGAATPGTQTTLTSAPISNNLRINIYRTDQGTDFNVDGDIFLVASIPNNSDGTAVQVYVDEISDAELGREFDDPAPDEQPFPPPISKYVKAFGNQMFYAGGERGNPENSDRVFFSEGNFPESISLANSFINVPNVDDDITGIGVAGTTLVITKNQSLWAVTGNLLANQVQVVQIAPGTNIGCVAHATIASVGTLMYFLHTNGVFAITENQLYPTDAFGNPIPLSVAIDGVFRTTPYLPQTRYQFKRAVALNYTKDNQYLLFLPCEDTQSSIRTANAFSTVFCYDYQEKNWFPWFGINAAGGMFVIDDDLYFQERRFSAVDGNVANLYKQHRFYRLIDHADHAGPQRAVWKSSWEDLGQPEVRKKFCRCVLLMDRLSELYQYNNPKMTFSTYLNRLPNLQNTIADITQTDNIRNSSWSYSGWGWNFWSGYQDSFITINLKQGTVAKSIQVGFEIQGINMDIRLAGFQLETIPENRKSVLR